MAKIATCLRSEPKGWELDRYVFSSWRHIYLMFLISVLPNMEGQKYLFGDVTLTRTVPIWGVLPKGAREPASAFHEGWPFSTTDLAYTHIQVFMTRKEENETGTNIGRRRIRLMNDNDRSWKHNSNFLLHGYNYHDFEAGSCWKYLEPF